VAIASATEILDKHAQENGTTINYKEINSAFDGNIDKLQEFYQGLSNIGLTSEDATD
jgi:hypothetical protein